MLSHTFNTFYTDMSASGNAFFGQKDDNYDDCGDNYGGKFCERSGVEMEDNRCKIVRRWLDRHGRVGTQTHCGTNLSATL